MRVGIPSEVKNHEYRVAATPAGVHELVSHDHEVLVERGAGLGSSITDEDYLAAGAKIVDTADHVWGDAELVLKVKEPIESEYHRMRSEQVLFTYLHLAASPACTAALLGAGTTSIAYETVQLPNGAVASPAPTPRPSPSAWVPRSPCSTGTSTSCASSTGSTAARSGR